MKTTDHHNEVAECAHQIEANPPTRYYLIGVRQGSQADKLTDRLVNGFNNCPSTGIVDHAVVAAPSLPYAMAKIASIYGFAQALLIHLSAQMKRWGHKKSA